MNQASSSGMFALIERSEEHTSELQSRLHLVCRLLLEKKKKELIRLLVALLDAISHVKRLHQRYVASLLLAPHMTHVTDLIVAQRTVKMVRVLTCVVM